MNKAERFFAVKGMNDILPTNMVQWRKVEKLFEKLAMSYGYQEIRTPVVEHSALFNRSVGELTDIVEKEMYSFVDVLNGEQLSLRPENTASVVRAVIEHNLLYDGPKRLWYRGPMFRHERPQRGRYRQFHQIGVEAIGFPGSEVDAELILMCANLWKALGIQTNLRLELNCLGSLNERLEYRAALLDYFSLHKDVIALDETAKRRVELNPLRILDSKKKLLQPLLLNAPNILDFLGSTSLDHFKELQFILKDNGVSFEINPRLVRGLDYYNLTVFEWVTDDLGSQGTVAAGGRYDSLVSQLGGGNIPGCGWAMGVERLIELLSASKKTESLGSEKKKLLYIIYDHLDRMPLAIRTAEMLRSSGFNAILYSSLHEQKKLSLKIQFKHADRSGAYYALVLGEREANGNLVVVKPLRGSNNKLENAVEQCSVRMEDLVPYLNKLLFHNLFKG